MGTLANVCSPFSGPFILIPYHAASGGGIDHSASEKYIFWTIDFLLFHDEVVAPTRISSGSSRFEWVGYYKIASVTRQRQSAGGSDS